MKPKQEVLPVLSNAETAPGHFIIEFRSPRIARGALPGQFVQILVEDKYEPLLPRPFSFLDAAKDRFRILYQVVGKGTALLAKKKKGNFLRVLGPLGNGFTVPGRGKHEVLLVGGGVGIPPLYHLARYLSSSRMRGSKRSPDSRLSATKRRQIRPTALWDGSDALSGGRGNDIKVFLGARTKSFLHCEKDFKALGLKIYAATDDGSKGHRGFVTEILDEYLGFREDSEKTAGKAPRASLYTCGPTPMLRAVSQLAFKYDISCQVSVEEPMPCGFGACLGCAIRVRDREPTVHSKPQCTPGVHCKVLSSVVDDLSASPYRYAMSCCEGPVFDAKEIVWE